MVEAKTSDGTIIHLVLDEFIGIEGIPVDIAGGSALKEELKQFFLGNEFRLHGGAFSQSSVTATAMKGLLNGPFSPSQQTAVENGPRRSAWHLGRNAWFEKLAAKGYAIQIYDNSWVGYCAEENTQIELCYLSRANSIKHLENLEVPNIDKAKVILSAFLELSSIKRFLLKIANLPIYRLGALATPEALESLAETVVSSESGRLFFMHLLNPHFGYLFHADCEIKRDSDTWTNRTLPFHQSRQPTNTPASRIERYKAYFAQIRCLQHQLQAFFDKLRAAGRYDESTIIIHGDHGSRIAIWNPSITVHERLSDRDIIDNYSTLYAVKQPGVPPAYDLTERSIQALFAETFLGRPLRPESGDIVLRGAQRFERNPGDGSWLRPFPGYHP